MEHSCTGACAHRCTGRCSMNVNARWSQSLKPVWSARNISCRSSVSSHGPELDQTGGWCVFHPFFFLLIFFDSPRRSTHRHCGLSDCAAGCLPDLRRAPRFQQVLGESPAGFGCHLLIWGDSWTQIHRSSKSPVPALKMSIGALQTRVRAHTDTRTHTHTHESLHTLSRPPRARQPWLWKCQVSFSKK